MGIVKTIKDLLAPPKIAGRSTLAEFLESRSAYLVQKSIMEYSQARANMLFSTLLGEKLFREAYEASRWASYPAAFAMVAETCACHVRDRTGIPALALNETIMAMASDIFAKFGEPSGLPEAFWNRALEHLRRDLAHAAMADPRPAGNIVLSRAAEIFDSLPVSPEIKRHDFEMFRNTLRFHLVEIRSEFEARADAEALARTLP